MRALVEKGKLSKLTIFYNSRKNDKAPEKEMENAFSPDLPTRYVDMNSLDSVGVHDLFVRGGKASQYYNHGVYFEETQTARVWRLKSGEWELYPSSTGLQLT
ncbi:hypothetical protein A2703_03830 [Candidatus Collierbacteria bacterium RIFCSPHIGHO2_01_FULL_50_25]|uniref:Uncharacterized protein n=2 Tax=Candidatus Collieribacteriota TaxID=1752725 RepID=A0A1F5EXI4_9BACT|nr:MAG: hypothetical protein A2703_03830 [Candidatus Collierbacteria bacterium RIFCSPHIGHO2_01_FULL_50_25]